MDKKGFLSIVVLLLTIGMLPGCKWFNGNKNGSTCVECASCPGASVKDTSEVLISVDGEPALTVKKFEDFINQMAESNEQVKLVRQIMPDFDQQLFEMKQREIIINKWAEKEGIRNSDEYRKKEKMIIDSVRTQLDTEEFFKKFKAEPSEDEIKKYYDENKDKDPRILAAPAGVTAMGVSFRKQEAANDFASKVNAKNFEKIAKDQKLSVARFGVVTSESMIDNNVKNELMKLKDFPVVKVVKGEKGKFWVIFAKSKEKSQFRPYEQAKEMIKRILLPKKMEEIIKDELPKLKSDFKIVENKEYFERIKKQREQKAEQQTAAQQAQAPVKTEAEKKA